MMISLVAVVALLCLLTASTNAGGESLSQLIKSKLRAKATTSSIPTVSTKGRAFVLEDGTRFMVRGVAFSSNVLGRDYLADEWFDLMNSTIVPKFQYLNINLIRVYQVDPTVSHEKVMNLLAENGIYVMVGTATEKDGENINRASPTYDPRYKSRVESVIDAFAQFPNTFGFSLANELAFIGNYGDNINQIVKGQFPFKQPEENDIMFEFIASQVNAITSGNARVLKSAIRDARAYMKAKGYRAIPLGMAIQDGGRLDGSVPPSLFGPGAWGTDDAARYYACGSDEERADFVGINSYSYVACGPNQHAYDRFVTNWMVNATIPMFLSEAGGMGGDCERKWGDVPISYTSPLVSPYMSGEVAFQFFNKKENFGLYIESFPELNETKLGGASYLAEEFGAAKSLEPLPADEDLGEYECESLISIGGFTVSEVSAPSCLFGYELISPPSTPAILVKIEWFGTDNTVQGFLVQKSNKIAAIPVNYDCSGSACPEGVPTSTIQTYVDPSVDAYFLESIGSWGAICVVPANTIQPGGNGTKVIKVNNQGWGNVPCQIE